MRTRWMMGIGALAVMAATFELASGRVAGQGAQDAKGGAAAGGFSAKLPWGDPDLRGIWTPEQVPTPMQRPAQYGTREFLTEQEIAEIQKQAMERYERALKAADPAGPRSTADLERTKNTVERGIYGAEYNNVWMERPVKPGPLRWTRTSLIVDPPEGVIPPYTPELVKRLEEREAARRHRGEADTWEDRNLNERCMTPQSSTGIGGTIRIIQSKGLVAILPDGLQFARIIPTDGRAQVSPKIRGWFGRSRGRWEGDKLVIETTNFIPKLDGGPVLASRRPFQVGYIGSGETLKRIETYRRVGEDQIEYGMTTDDPKVFVKPWTVLRPMKLDNEFLMLQGACHEGNYGMPNILNAGRADEGYALRAALEAAEERKPQLAAMKKRTEEYVKTGKITAPEPPRGPVNADQ